MNKNQINQILNYSLIILYLIIGFVPNLNAIDKIGPQFLYLSILNSATIVYLISNGGYLKILKKTFENNLILYLLFLFWSWSLISLFHAFNKIETIIEASRIFIYLISYVNLLILIKFTKIDTKKVLLGFSLVLGIEVLLVLNRFYEIFLSDLSTEIIFGRNLELKAFTGNINITAFTMALKTPFLILFLSHKKSIHYLFKVLTISIVFFTIFVLGSRGANLTIGILVISIAALGFLNYSFINKKLSILVLAAFVLAISFNYFTFRSNDNLNYLSRTSNILDTSSQKRIGYYKYALQSIIDNPLFGIGLGNWKIYSITSESQEYDEYQIPYHVHNDFLEVAAEIGIIGMILFYGIYLYLFVVYVKFFKRPKIPELDKILGVAITLGLVVYLIDSFLNFPFTRPVMQIPNLFLIGLSVYLINKNGVYLFEKSKFFLNDNLTKSFIIFSLIGLIVSIYISYSLFNSLKEQNFLIVKTRGFKSDYGPDDIYKIDSRIPNISAHTIPIDAMKATLLIRLGILDSVSKLVDKGLVANPYIGYPELVKSIYFLNKTELDSTYYYAKKAYNIFPKNFNHFDHYINMIEFKRDSLELEKLYADIKDNYNEKKYTKYLQVSSRLKNNLSLTDQDLIEKLSINNPLNSVNKAFTIMGEIGRENVKQGLIMSNKAQKFYRQNNFKQAAELFLEASQYNPIEIAYLENAANCFMKMDENNKAITILEKVLTELNPKTGKTEYILGIIYLDMDQSDLGCEYLVKSKEKGFNFPDAILNQFCKKE